MSCLSRIHCLLTTEVLKEPIFHPHIERVTFVKMFMDLIHPMSVLV